MPLRSTWKGYLKISLISVPLRAYTAADSSRRPISLNQLHATCKNRINYRKVCPLHGEVSNDEIVSGYEYAKGQYVVIDPDELDRLRSEGDRSITIETFVGSDAVDPIYHSGQTYYLLPDGPVGQKPYALIQRSMTEEGLSGIGQVVLSSRERLVLVRPLEDLLIMTVLQHEAEVKSPAAFQDELGEVDGSKQELALTKNLLEALTSDRFDIGDFRDRYVEKLTELIEAKVAGKELVSPPPTEEPAVINLMDALKKSVQQAGKSGGRSKRSQRMAQVVKSRRSARRKSG
jgi:DNA end-binding protein Ku